MLRLCAGRLIMGWDGPSPEHVAPPHDGRSAQEDLMRLDPRWYQIGGLSMLERYWQNTAALFCE